LNRLVAPAIPRADRESIEVAVDVQQLGGVAQHGDRPYANRRAVDRAEGDEEAAAPIVAAATASLSQEIPKKTRLSKQIAPESGRRRSASVLISADLPAAFSPHASRCSPALTFAVASSGATAPENRVA
jgi:hypothetical protein